MRLFDRILFLAQNNQDQAEAIIARTALEHLEKLPEMSQSSFCKEAGISKAGLHRFYSAGGFESFNAFKNELFESWQKYRMSPINPSLFLQPDVKNLKALKNLAGKARRVALYGNRAQVERMYLLKSYLASVCDLRILNSWNIQTNLDFLKSLQKDDVFILADLLSDLERLMEEGITHPGRIDLTLTEGLDCHRFYIGPVSSLGSPFLSLYQKSDQSSSLYDLIDQVDLAFAPDGF